MPNRIEVSSSLSGPANYTLGVNPSGYDASDNTKLAKIEVLHGSAVWQQTIFDSELRTFAWKGFPITNTAIEALTTYFRSVLGSVRYFNFKDMDDINEGWPVTGTWKKARIISFNIKYREGGKLFYDSINLTIQPEE